MQSLDIGKFDPFFSLQIGLLLPVLNMATATYATSNYTCFQMMLFAYTTGFILLTRRQVKRTKPRMQETLSI